LRCREGFVPVLAGPKGEARFSPFEPGRFAGYNKTHMPGMNPDLGTTAWSTGPILSRNVSTASCWARLLALIASGLTIIYGTLGVLNLAHGAMFRLGGYAGWVAFTYTGSFVVAGGIRRTQWPIAWSSRDQ
jgi:hypothetical protein